MIDEASPTGSSPESSEPSRPARRRAEQDQRLANFIGEATRLISGASGEVEAGPLLAKRGYTAEKLALGLGLATGAQEAFDARQVKDSAAVRLKEARDEGWELALEVFGDYRATVQVLWSGAARRTLGASGPVPRDLQKFISAARGSYAAAQGSDYAPLLAENGLAEAFFADALAGIDALEKADTAFVSGEGAATAATQARDTAGRELRAWVAAFRKLGRLALKGRPDLKLKIGL